MVENKVLRMSHVVVVTVGSVLFLVDVHIHAKNILLKPIQLLVRSNRRCSSVHSPSATTPASIGHKGVGGSSGGLFLLDIEPL